LTKIPSGGRCIKRSIHAVAYAHELVSSTGGDVEFSCEDAGRSDPAFLVEVCAAVIEAGATTINVPDTVGYTLPQEYGSLIK